MKADELRRFAEDLRFAALRATVHRFVSGEGSVGADLPGGPETPGGGRSAQVQAGGRSPWI